MPNWIDRAFHLTPWEMDIERKYTDIVLTLNGRDYHGEMYTVTKLPIENYLLLRKMIENGQAFEASDFGYILASGRGVAPPDVVEALMTGYKSVPIMHNRIRDAARLANEQQWKENKKYRETLCFCYIEGQIDDFTEGYAFFSLVGNRLQEMMRNRERGDFPINSKQYNASILATGSGQAALEILQNMQKKYLYSSNTTHVRIFPQSAAAPPGRARKGYNVGRGTRRPHDYGEQIEGSDPEVTPSGQGEEQPPQNRAKNPEKEPITVHSISHFRIGLIAVFELKDLDTIEAVAHELASYNTEPGDIFFSYVGEEVSE